MARFKIGALGEYELMLGRLANTSKAIAKKAVYAGADVLADEIRENIEALPTTASRQHRNLNFTGGDRLYGISPTVKQALLDGLGVSPIKNDDGVWNAKIGFEGYAPESTATKTYPRGLPIPLLARSIESGSSYRPKQPFVRPAVQSAGKRAQKAMADVIDQECKKTMK